MKKIKRMSAMILTIFLLVGCSTTGKENNENNTEYSTTKVQEDNLSGNDQYYKSDTSSENTEDNNSGDNTANNSDIGATTIKPVNGVGYPSSSGALHVEGSQLIDSNGKAIQLRGISTHGLAWFPQYVNEDAFSQFRQEWNMNVIRLAMYTAEYGGYSTGGDKEGLKNLIRKGVQYATAQDMYVIIDWHILSDNNPNIYKSDAKAFFEQMSKEFAAYNNVIYEICNEPNSGTSWEEIKAYAEDVIPVIRNNDSDAVIIVGTPNWSQYVDQAAANPITNYNNIMYSLHFYAATHKDDLRNKMVDAIEAGLPVFISEYGISDASGNGRIDENQANKWVDTMNKYGVSYIAWNLSNKEESSSIIKSSSNKTSGFTESDLTSSGKWLYRMLTGNSSFESLNTQKTEENGEQSKEIGNTQEQVTNTQPVKDTNTGNTNQSNNNQQTQTTPDTGNSSQNNSQQVELTNAEINYTVQLVNSWESNGEKFYHYTLTLKNTSSKNGNKWAIKVPFNEVVKLSDGWNGNYTVNGTELQITSKEYNGTIATGGVVGDVGFIVSGSSNLNIIQ